ncbi:MAG: hypothetical protein RIS52_1305 [Pseudomonadota bacterium]
MFQRFAGFIKRHPIWTLILALALGAIIYRVLTPTPPTYEYVSEAVGRGEVVSKVTASGKLRALNTVKVGAEVSGQVLRVTVDFNSPVKAGQVLAEIDPTRFRARVLQAEAQVSLGRAALAQAEASLTRTQTDVGIQQREFSRRRQLSNQGYISKAGLDGAVGQLSSAQAGYRTAVAQVASARAQIQQSSAELTTAQLELRRTVILAPTSGVVINKLIEPGSTVAASFQTPNLFEIAADTTRMQVEASVDEADIGRIAEGQEVRFTVDAYPDATFPAFVRQIRKAAAENQNVVSYLVILEVDNKDGKLLPGMTANVEIITGAKQEIIRVPTQAIRFRPRAADLSDADKKATEKQEQAPDDKKRNDAAVYVVGSDLYKPMRRRVTFGLQGEDFVEITSGLRAGEKIVVRSRSLAKKQADPSDDEGSNDSAS